MTIDPNDIGAAWRSHVARTQRAVAAHYQRTGDTTRLARMSTRTADSAAPPCTTCASVRRVVTSWSQAIRDYYSTKKA